MTDAPAVLPRAVVSITVEKLLGLGAARKPAHGTELYAAITVDNRFLGRSAPFSGMDSLDLGGLFEHVVIPTDDRKIQVIVDLHATEGDQEDLVTPLQQLLLDLAPPWPSGLFTNGGPTKIEVSVATRLVPPLSQGAVAARTTEDKNEKTKSTLALTDALVAVFVDVEGLYPPTASFDPAQRQPGYTSADHKGRVYVCHDRRTGKRVREGQSVLASVRLVSVGPSLAPPPPPLVRWRFIDVDDPTDDRPDVLTPFRGYLDPNDFTPRGEGPFATPIGSHGGDNEGAPKRSPPWEEAPGFSLSFAGEDSAVTEATAVSGSSPLAYESEVILHCPSLAGDNFVLEAEPVASGVDCFLARTGVITMWQRIDVQCYRAGDVKALELPDLQIVRAAYEKACVQIDFAAEVIAVDDLNGGVHVSELLSTFDAYDKHAHEPGWFAVSFVSQIIDDGNFETDGVLVFPSKGNDAIVTAKFMESAKPPSAKAGPMWQYVDVATDPIPDGARLGIAVERIRLPKTLGTLATEHLSGGLTRIWVRPEELNPVFLASDGAKDDAYAFTCLCFPTIHLVDHQVLGNGFHLQEGEDVAMKIYHEKPTEKLRQGVWAGMTGNRKIGGRSHFANFVFVDATKPLGHWPVAHELGHALGFPHMCGYPALELNRCIMGYPGDWQFTDERLWVIELPPIDLATFRTFCARHTKELRRAVLERNPAYLWKFDGDPP